MLDKGLLASLRALRVYGNHPSTDQHTIALCKKKTVDF
jgi:hypothetical protein